MPSKQDEENLQVAIRRHKSALGDLVELQELEDEAREAKEEEIQNGVLSLDVTKTITILLSFGGPSDGFDIQLDKENEVISGVYWFADWGYRKEFTLDDDELNLVVDSYLAGDPAAYL